MANYTFLVNDIIQATENDSTEFETQITYLVEKAEDRLIKELDDSGLDYYSSFTFTSVCPAHLTVLNPASLESLAHTIVAASV